MKFAILHLFFLFILHVFYFLFLLFPSLLYSYLSLFSSKSLLSFFHFLLHHFTSKNLKLFFIFNCVLRLYFLYLPSNLILLTSLHHKYNIYLFQSHFFFTFFNFSKIFSSFFSHHFKNTKHFPFLLFYLQLTVFFFLFLQYLIFFSRFCSDFIVLLNRQ